MLKEDLDGIYEEIYLLNQNLKLSFDDLKEIYSVFDCKLNLEHKNVQWANARISGSDTVVVSERKFSENLVPNVVGMGLMDALYVLENAGLEVKVEGRGRVKEQSVYPGSKIFSNQKIKLILG